MSVDYHYQYKVYNKSGSDYNWSKRWERVTENDFGLDGVIGLDYMLKEVPFSFFTDLIIFCELFDDPFLFKMQGGLGVRYNF